MTIGAQCIEKGTGVIDKNHTIDENAHKGRQRIFAYISMTVALLLLPLGMYVIAVISGRPLWGLSAFLVTLALHLPQLPGALRIGREKNLSAARIVFMTVFFGASWWKPLEKGIIDR
jgi:uncharacterized membrane protein